MHDWLDAVRRQVAREGLTLPAEVIDEVAQHIADLHRSLALRGVSAAEADAAAEAELTRVRELSEAIAQRVPQRARGMHEEGRWFVGIGRDVVHAARLLVSKRAYSSVVVVTLAVGIGGCAAVFSLFNSLLLSPLPFPQPDRLVLLWETTAANSAQRFVVSAPNFNDWQRATHSFKDMAMMQGLTFNLAGAAEPQQISGHRVSAALFEVLGVKPALGRTFTRAEEKPGYDVAVISDAVWRQHFAGARRALGQSIRLNGKPHEIIGVMPAGFDFPTPMNGVWVPIALSEADLGRDWHSFVVVARLHDDVSFEQARGEIERLGAEMRQQFTENRNEGATAERMARFGMANTERMLTILGGAVALVLLIACANVASLQLAFGLSRQREFATRFSLGARYSVLVRQLLVEALAMAALGCAGGIALAFAATRSLDVVLARGFRRLPFRGEIPVTLDLRVVLFAIAIAGVAALIFGLAPLRALRRQALTDGLRSGDRGATRAAARTRRVLVTVEIALAIVVLSGAGLMVRSLTRVLGQSPGLDPSNVLVMRASLPGDTAPGGNNRSRFCADLARESASVPGLVHVSAVNYLPLDGSNADRIITIEGRPAPAGDQLDFANYRTACPNYFTTLAITRLSGRDFGAEDTPTSLPVTIVNRAFVDHYWPKQDAIAKRFKVGRIDSTNGWLTVIGVVENVHHFALEETPMPEFYRPYAQASSAAMTLVAKTAGEPLAWQSSMRDVLKRVDPELPAAGARAMDDVISQSVAWRETPMRLLLGFAAIGLLLAAIGVYGVLSYYVSQRRREIGVRVALGASKAAVVRLVLKESATPLVAGLVIGVLGSLLSGRLLADLLYDVQPGDPIVLAGIVAVLAVVALVSGWVPARTAAATDPLVALRED